MQNLNQKNWIFYLTFIFIIGMNLHCFKPYNSGFLPIGAQGLEPYTSEDLGIPIEEENSSTASLPIISAKEGEAIGEFLQGLDDMGIMTDVGLKTQSVEAWKTIRFSAFSNDEMNDKIFREMRGEIVPDKIAGTNAELMVKESNAADEFFGGIEAAFPELSEQELIDVRTQLTVALVILRLQIDFGDKVNGMPEEFLVMIRTKNVALRQKITQELILRGVTEL